MSFDLVPGAHREDVVCPACPDPETAFRLEDVGMKLTTEDDLRVDVWVRVTVSRPAWEAVMLDHLRAVDDDSHRQLFDWCMTELARRRLSAQDVARTSVQAAAESVDEMLRAVLPRPRP